MEIPESHGIVVTTFTAAGRSEDLSFSLGYYHPDDEPATDHANRFFDIWKLQYQAQMCNEITVQYVTAYFQGTSGPLQFGISDRAAYNGTLGVGAQSPATSVLVRKNTGFAGAKYRGRMFLPAPRDADVDSGGNLSSAQRAQFNGKLALVLTSMADNGVLGWSMPARLLHTDGTSPTSIASLVCDPLVGTQRRRQR